MKKLESLNDSKFNLSATEMSKIKGGWRFWGRERRTMSYGSSTYTQTHQYILGANVWNSRD